MIKTKGMTLTEILIVVVVLAILASLMIPRFTNQRERGVVAEAIANLSAIRQAEAAWSLEQPAPAFTNNLANLDVTVTQGLTFNYAIVVAAGPTFTATATRVGGGPCDATHFGTCTITITDAGGWGGNHAYRPN